MTTHSPEEITLFKQKYMPGTIVKLTEGLQYIYNGTAIAQVITEDEFKSGNDAYNKQASRTATSHDFLFFKFINGKFTGRVSGYMWRYLGNGIVLDEICVKNSVSMSSGYWNTTCKKCGKPAWLGALLVECSNPDCK